MIPIPPRAHAAIAAVALAAFVVGVVWGFVANNNTASSVVIAAALVPAVIFRERKDGK